MSVIHYTDEKLKNIALCYYRSHNYTSNISKVTCNRCLDFYPKYLKIVDLIGTIADISVAEIAQCNKEAVYRLRNRLGIELLYDRKADWKVLNISSFYKIEVNSEGIFRRCHDKWQYSLYFSKQKRRLFIHVKSLISGKYHQLCAAKLIYQTFNGLVLQSYDKILFLDGNPVNLELSNLRLQQRQ